MSDGDGRSLLAGRLNRLFDDIRPEGRNGRRWTNDEVAVALKRSEPTMRVSGAYLSALRTGAKRRPSTEILIALARFFGVPLDYFVDDDAAARTEAELELAKVAGNLGVRRLALRALELSPEALATVTEIIDQVIALDDKLSEPSIAMPK
ncbi:MAG: helix-turn-helix transcriptional regulator [Kutzneria sp.]|nr:helix-turn-helix transcriptional regulator [Kutzneria sp.]